MDGYGIKIGTKRGEARYRSGDEEAWELDEACERAFALLHMRQAGYVIVGNDDHHFCMWGDVDRSTYDGFNQNGRWARWFVDVEINGRRWIYQPAADIDDYEGAGGADDIAEQAAGLHPVVTRLWVGLSDGSEEVESPVSRD
jgi:hypothetical protein